MQSNALPLGYIAYNLIGLISKWLKEWDCKSLDYYYLHRFESYSIHYYQLALITPGKYPKLKNSFKVFLDKSKNL